METCCGVGRLAGAEAVLSPLLVHNSVIYTLKYQAGATSMPGRLHHSVERVVMYSVLHCGLSTWRQLEHWALFGAFIHPVSKSDFMV